MPHLFDPITIRNLTLRNRIVLSPMCMYSAGEDGRPTDFHFVHLVTRAIGGVGLIIQEATAVEKRGRISENDLGLWDDFQIEPLTRLVRACQSYGAKVAVQLAHAGRKAFTAKKGAGPQPIVGPSPIPHDQEWVVPQELTPRDIDTIVDAFAMATRRALAVGYDIVEIHAAHGYLNHQFLSPLSNRRTDAYGGILANRMRFLCRVVDTVRAVWPEDRPLFVRISCTDWVDGGLTIEDQIEVARALRTRGVDVIDCSSGGIVPWAKVPFAPGYQIPFAERIRREVGIATGAVGLITTPEMAEEIIHNSRADLVLLGRELLRHPYWPLDAARALGVDIPWPIQYIRAKL